jgi:hypothetical protein
MKPGDGAIELPLGLWVTGDGEVDLAELFRSVVSMLVSLLRTYMVDVTERYHEKGQR